MQNKTVKKKRFSGLRPNSFTPTSPKLPRGDVSGKFRGCHGFVADLSRGSRRNGIWPLYGLSSKKVRFRTTSETCLQMFNCTRGWLQLIRAIEKSYVISINSVEDIKNLYKSLGLVRSLLMVQVGPDEEELLKASIWSVLPACCNINTTISTTIITTITMVLLAYG